MQKLNLFCLTSCVYRGKGFKPCSLVIPFKFCVLWLGKNEVKFGKIGLKFGKKENNYLPLFFKRYLFGVFFFIKFLFLHSLSIWGGGGGGGEFNHKEL